MATRYWQGNGAALAAQISQATITGYDATSTYAVTIGGAVVSTLGTGGTVTTTAVALVALLTATALPQFTGITWTNSAGTIIGTADTAGIPFTFTLTVSGGSGTVGSVSTPTPNGSGNDISNALNWSSQTLPGAGDTIIFANGSVAALYGLSYLASTSIALCQVFTSYTATIGLPTVNAAGYPEYLPQELQFGTCTILQEYLPAGLGAAARKYNVGSNACTATFTGQGNGKLGSEITWFRGTSASNVVNAQAASLAIAAIPGYTATVATLNSIQGSVVRCGIGCGAITTATVTATTLSLAQNLTTLTVSGASSVLCANAMTVGTFTINGGSVVYNSTGTITTLVIGSQETTGSIDFSQGLGAVTITNLITAYKGSTFNDPLGRVTAADGITVPAGQISDLTTAFALGNTFTW